MGSSATESRAILLEVVPGLVLLPTLCSNRLLVDDRLNLDLISAIHSSPFQRRTRNASSTKSIQFVPINARQNIATSTLPSFSGSSEISATVTNLLVLCKS